MSVRIGQASLGETGAHGQKPGNQTGRELNFAYWYSGSWLGVLRFKDRRKAELAARACEAGVGNKNIGYDQDGRNTAYVAAEAVDFILSKIAKPVETDCSAFMMLCAISAGVDALKETYRKQGNSCTTYCMMRCFPATGEFELLTDRKYLTSDAYLRRGDILQRLRRQRGVTAAMPPEQSESKRYTIRKRPHRYPPVKRGSFRALYLYYLYLLSPRKRKPQKIPFETRAEIRRAKQYRQQFFLLQKYHIDTKPELDMLSDALSNEMQILVDRRKELYALRREQPSEQLDADIDSLTAQLRPLRRELRLCGKIAEYSPRMLRQVRENNTPPTENHAPDKARERRSHLWR